MIQLPKSSALYLIEYLCHYHVEFERRFVAWLNERDMDYDDTATFKKVLSELSDDQISEVLQLNDPKTVWDGVKWVSENNSVQSLN